LGVGSPVSNETVTAHVVLGLPWRRPKRQDRKLSTALAEKMAALDIHEQVALRDGHASLISADGCIRIVYSCRVNPCNAAHLVRRVDRRITRRYCTEHALRWNPREAAWEQDLPRIVALSDELWTALEVAFGVLAGC